MTFTAETYVNFIADKSPTRQKFFPEYHPDAPRRDFDIIIIGSGMGGGILADDLTDRQAQGKRILILEAGSFTFPTHVYNCSRFDNATVARAFDCKTFWQTSEGNQSGFHYIHERPQINFGGRSIFWSGLIPTVQSWELDYFPDSVRNALKGGLLKEAGQKMNESVSLGKMARDVVAKLRSNQNLSDNFDILETPRALHQPYLQPGGQPSANTFVEPTGVFNTAELLINQLGPGNGRYHGDLNGLFLQLNRYVEDLKELSSGGYELITRDPTNGQSHSYYAGKVVLAAGSIGSSKLLKRSTLGRTLSAQVQGRIGTGFTDHPTTRDLYCTVTEMDGLPIQPDDHAKIIFYSKGKRTSSGEIRYPFNIEMNINHNWWHRRDNDPSDTLNNADPFPHIPDGKSVIDTKFSFANCLEDWNVIEAAPSFNYVPKVNFRNLQHTDHLTGHVLPNLAGWQKSADEIWSLLNKVTDDIYKLFKDGNSTAQRVGSYGKDGKGFGHGTVHHAVGTLRMPFRGSLNGSINHNSVVDEDLKIKGTHGVYVCDMSVMPCSTAANPVRTLAALALRLSKHLG